MRYIALFKPFNVLSSFTHEEVVGQPSRGLEPREGAEIHPKRTLSEFDLPQNVYAAGRLDYDSEGLLVLSDDGAFIHRLTDPAHKLPKTYYAQVEGTPTEDALGRLRRGVRIKTYTTQPCRARALPQAPELPPRDKPITPHGPTAWLELILTEGKKRQVRHMTAAVGLPTLRLVRVQIGPITLAGLRPGQWRDLTKVELDSIIHFSTQAHTSRRVQKPALRRKINQTRTGHRRSRE